MSFLRRLFTWTLVVAIAFSLGTVRFIQADPTDDFSLTLGHGPDSGVYTLMSEKHVAEILADRLDLFPKSQTPKLAQHLLDLCSRYRFDPAFILALIQTESAFHVKALSPVGAIGLMQLMPATAAVVLEDWGMTLAGKARPSQQAIARALTDPFTNITLGITYLAWLRDHYRGLSPYYLVAAYNVGPARMDELMARKSFRPRATKKYYEDIRRRVPGLRFYRKPSPDALRS